MSIGYLEAARCHRYNHERFFKAFHARAVVDTRPVLLSYQMTGYLSMI
jgi:hypothetical protein